MREEDDEERRRRLHKERQNRVREEEDDEERKRRLRKERQKRAREEEDDEERKRRLRKEKQNRVREEEDDEERKRRLRRKRRRKRARKIKRICLSVLITLLVVAVVAAGGFIYEALQVSKMDTNFPGVSINGVDVSGLTEEETVEALNAQGWDNSASTPLVVTTIDGVSFEVTPKAVGLAVPAEEPAAKAYASGREGSLIDDCVSYLKAKFLGEKHNITTETGPVDREYISGLVDQAISEVTEKVGTTETTVDTANSEIRVVKGAGQISLDREAFTDAVVSALQNGEKTLDYETLSKDLTCPDFQAIYDQINVEPQNAYFMEDGSFNIVDEVVGCTFDVAEAEKQWAAAKPGEEFSVPLTVTTPEVTRESLSSTLYCDLLGSCTTYYPNSNDARRNNLQLATSKINGYIMLPGDEFSYNTVVGARTEEAGFQYAAAYVNGEEKEEIGGGACQVSSTLYSATLFAFLETVERENHYFAVTYIQLGTDATVTIPTDGGRAIDFKFRNSRNYPIKIVGYCNNDESSITFEIWGTLEDTDYMPVEFDNSYNGQYPSDLKIDKADPDREGFIIQLVHETYTFTDDVGSGYRTVTWRYVINENGERVSEEMTNLTNSSGQHTMDTYYFHNQ